VGHDVAIGVAGEAGGLLRPVQAGHPHRGARLQGVHVGSDADQRESHHTILAASPQQRLRCGCHHVAMTTRRDALLAGGVAGVVGLAVAELVAAVMRTRLSPVQAVGEAIIELTPGSLAERAIDAVGQWDKPLLVGGVVVGLILASALAGLAGRRRPVLGTLVLLALAVVGVVAVMTRDDAGSLAFVAPAVGGAAAMGALAALLARTPAVAPDGAADTSSRRQFLIWSAAVVATAAVVGGVSRVVGQARRNVDAARAALSLGLSEAVAPKGVDLGVAGVEPWLTPAEKFYRIDTSLAPPLLEPQEWELRSTGRSTARSPSRTRSSWIGV
jgi:hypothetical protein